MDNIGIQVTLHIPREKIPISEVRTEIRKIEEIFYGDAINDTELIHLNRLLDQRINLPFNLSITASLIGNVVRLYGNTTDSKAVLDTNCSIEYISKTRVKRR